MKGICEGFFIMKTIELQPELLGDFKSPASLRIENTDVRINNVLGINSQGQLPARVMSGLIPTFSLAQTIMELSDGAISPQVRIFRPINIFKHTNGTSQESITHQVAAGNDLLSRFHTNFFPNIDMLVEEDKPVNAASLAVLSSVERVVEDHCDDDTLQALRKSGERHGGSEGSNNSFLYAAHHPFGWNDLHHTAIFESFPKGVVINTLPPSEKKFTLVRKTIVPHVAQTDSITRIEGGGHDLTINMSGTPHYNFLESNQILHEPAMDDVHSVSAVEVFNDLEHRILLEKDKDVKEKLKKIKRDFRTLIDFLTNGNKEQEAQESLPTMLGMRGNTV